jgi:hypothetical protein
MTRGRRSSRIGAAILWQQGQVSGRDGEPNRTLRPGRSGQPLRALRAGSALDQPVPGCRRGR